MRKWRRGKGVQVEFWADNCLTEIRLKRKYPDLYLIADKPFGKVIEFYSIQGVNLICWSIRFKPILSVHEKTQLEEVSLRLGESGIQHQQPDWSSGVLHKMDPSQHLQHMESSTSNKSN